ncbi:MAG: HAD family hydrolase [Treponema sp.]|jgi:putative hydrolase of the HAD superfamily|nr:HAD family hydrolase [Treponema sp.]
MQNNIKAITFDLDGTLYPNYRINIKLIPFTLKQWRLLSTFGKVRKIIRQEQEKNLQDSPQLFAPCSDIYEYQAQMTAKILSDNPEQIREKIDRLIYRGWEPLFKTVKLFKGVHETLETFRKAGYKLGLMSDFPPETKLKNLKVNDCWDTVQCSERCGALKPHPLPFIKLAQALSLPPQNILYVGNSYSYDVVGAARAGMKTAWLKPAFALNSKKMSIKPDFSFNNYRQLHDFVIR